MSIDVQTPENATHFGFETVAAAEKAGRVRAVFDAVAPKYDLMNDLMSGGVHRLWKDAMADWLAPRADWSIVDVAGGTGDIAFRLLDRMSPRAESGSVTVCDINQAMLEHGRDRALDLGKLGGLDWAVGNAESLPFPDMHFDAYTIAFGLRNVTEIQTALCEAKRVLKPGGRFLCLEFSKVVLPGLDKLYDTYSFSILPRLGQMVAGDSEAYQYLAESIRQFPEQDRLVDMMGDAGFGRVSYRNLAGGIAAIHSGWRL
ncbi:MAG: bifunctional demethylmenaquinone methyltransferase/2-methoxy-6-polyprenyl-1,4-benzoquinol methylase UbiE [Rhodospirillaceae bacterium]|jgi:demethylmenaquinone methyltransferase / 2-methoxy-6-polyprenyl-1,4-benzoquinol methylase|nr:bifunctional demethylmenaquinone methyltransferase/2-methoxy-6-polyprenyl-1,4-benzoquinol methylase UbiE [Rhodospirillaceae bacterium]MBT5564929.1 bifunctional demethylmenaquinone methyltransferase/2-methoxy-6-polyprenyl-1,4-benzoquinol methylase UbiE [Rhodospirillaceae bacterium]MBT6090529.1 bifunctional demethylmenaquinone methyltransferase/2-methoxy-6-polyprenyl-1,4-benzoquinol methylase UbiE [Rhodospirillaceae bacterium]MBT6959617.1 bifunctional demethylmenaquinone methyltransferase/2-met